MTTATTPENFTAAAESFAKVVAIFQVQLAALVAKLAKGEISEDDYLAEVSKSLATIDRLLARNARESSEFEGVHVRASSSVARLRSIASKKKSTRGR